MKFKPNLRILENANSLSELIISIARGSEPTVRCSPSSALGTLVAHLA